MYYWHLLGGKIVDTDDSVVTIHSSIFSSNVARCCSSAVVMNVEDGNLTVEKSTFENNQEDSNEMQAITTVRSNVTLNMATSDCSASLILDFCMLIVAAKQ